MKHVLFLATLSLALFFLTLSSSAQCPSGSLLFHNCAGSGSGGCISGCNVGVCNGPSITGDCSQQNMSVIITAPTPFCQMTITGAFKKYPSGSSGNCNSSGMDANDQLKVGGNAMVTGASNFDGTSTYTGAPGENITISGRSNRRDEVITYSVTCNGDCDPTLPVELLYLNGELTSTGIILQWATSSEINNDYFTIEYSNDGINFFPVMIIDGAGNSNSTIAYSSEVTDRFIGTTYFRLKQHDFDGKTTVYAQVFVLETNAENDFFIASGDESQVHLHAYHASTATIQVYNVVGNELVDQLSVELSVGENTLPLKKLSAGLYICSAVINNKMYTRKFMVH